MVEEIKAVERKIDALTGHIIRDEKALMGDNIELEQVD